MGHLPQPRESAEDQVAIALVLAGEPLAYRALVDRYQGPVYRLVRHLTPHPGHWEDLCQEVFLAGYLALGDFDPTRGRFLSWLLTIARHRCINARRRQEPSPPESVAEPTDYRHPAALAEFREALDCLDRTLATLPEEQREAFVLLELSGMTVDELATAAGVDPSTIRSRLSRAKARLRSALEQTQGEMP